MNWAQTKTKILMDKKNNIHPKNRWFIYVFRIGSFLYKKSETNLMYKPLSIFFRILWRITINKQNHYPFETEIGGGIRLPHNLGIIISGMASIGENCTIYHQVTIGIDELKSSKAPVIGNNCFIGAGAKIIGDICIGDNVIIGTNAIITKDIPGNVKVVGTNKII